MRPDAPDPACAYLRKTQPSRPFSRRLRMSRDAPIGSHLWAVGRGVPPRGNGGGFVAAAAHGGEGGHIAAQRAIAVNQPRPAA